MRSPWYMRGTFEERFWPKVDRRGADECWNWLAFKQPLGYGTFTGRPKHISYLAHRIAWHLTNGPVPDGLHVLHRCDNRACCNPSHLFLGTHQDNMRDRDAKGRGRKIGTPRALTLDQVLGMLDEFADGRSPSRVAAKYGVACSTAKRIKYRQSWRHVFGVAA